MSHYKAVIFDQDGVLVHLLPFFSTVDAAVSNLAIAALSNGTVAADVTKDEIYFNPKINGASFAGKLNACAKARDMAGFETDPRYKEFVVLRDAIVDTVLTQGIHAANPPEGFGYVTQCLIDENLIDGQGRVQIAVFPHVVDVLDNLAASGARIAVASTNHPQRVKGILASAGINHFAMDDIFGSDGTTIPGKPAPDVYLHAIARLEGVKDFRDLTDAQKRNYLSVEDSVTGAQAGVAALTHTVGIAQDPSKDFDMERANLERCGCPVVFRDFSDVGGYLRQQLGLGRAPAPSVAPAPKPAP